MEVAVALCLACKDLAFEARDHKTTSRLMQVAVKNEYQTCLIIWRTLERVMRRGTLYGQEISTPFAVKIPRS
jgi:hypothetical protein